MTIPILFGMIAMIIVILWNIDKSINRHINNFTKFGNETSDKLDKLERIQEGVEQIRDITTMTEGQKLRRDLKIDRPEDYKDIMGD